MQRGRERLRFFDKPFVSWRNDIALFLGPRLAGYSALDVADLTAVEVRSHELMAAHLELLPARGARIRRAPTCCRARRSSACATAGAWSA